MDALSFAAGLHVRPFTGSFYSITPKVRLENRSGKKKDLFAA